MVGSIVSLIVTVAVSEVSTASKLPPDVLAIETGITWPSRYTSSPCAGCGADVAVSWPAANVMSTPLFNFTVNGVSDA